MTRTQFTFFAIIALISVLIMTNPKEEDHKVALKNKLTRALQTGIKRSTENNELYGIIGQGVGLMIGGYFVDKVVDNVSRENYILFSTTTMTWEGEMHKVGIGALGNVFLSSQLDKELNRIVEGKESKKSGYDLADDNREPRSRNQLDVEAIDRLNKQEETDNSINNVDENLAEPTKSEDNTRIGSYTVANNADSKVYFYKQPDEESKKSAYLIAGQEVEVQKIVDEYGYVEFTNSSGKVTKGWLMMKFLEINQ